MLGIRIALLGLAISVRTLLFSASGYIASFNRLRQPFIRQTKISPSRNHIYWTSQSTKLKQKLWNLLWSNSCNHSLIGWPPLEAHPKLIVELIQRFLKNRTIHTTQSREPGKEQFLLKSCGGFERTRSQKETWLGSVYFCCHWKYWKDANLEVDNYA
jgi:hypothetical protein